METNRESFASLMTRWREGCPSAAETLYQEYGRAILNVVRRHLDGRLRRRYDSEDFTQAVWASFLVRPAGAPVFEDPRELIRYLARMTRNKLLDARRHRVRECESAPASGWLPQDAAGNAPTPSQEAMAAERWQDMLIDQSPFGQRILQMLREGRPYQEIAANLGMSKKVIQRLIRRLTRFRGMER